MANLGSTDLNSIWLQEVRMGCTVCGKKQGVICKKRSTLFISIQVLHSVGMSRFLHEPSRENTSFFSILAEPRNKYLEPARLKLNFGSFRHYIVLHAVFTIQYCIEFAISRVFFKTGNSGKTENSGKFFTNIFCWKLFSRLYSSRNAIKIFILGQKKIRILPTFLENF